MRSNSFCFAKRSSLRHPFTTTALLESSCPRYRIFPHGRALTTTVFSLYFCGQKNIIIACCGRKNQHPAQNRALPCAPKILLGMQMLKLLDISVFLAEYGPLQRRNMASNLDRSLLDPSGNPLPPCIVMERGESLEVWSARAKPDRSQAFTVWGTAVCSMLAGLFQPKNRRHP